MSDMRFFGTFTKVDEDQRIVGGTFTSEAVDSQNDVVDFGATKEAVAEWDQWRNIREMHQPRAAGVATTIQLDEVAKAGYLEAKIVDDAAWTKVKEKVYKGFSIGGKVLDAVLEKSGTRRITKYLLTEVSLVDRPANPEAVFTFAKREDGDLQKAEWDTAYVNDLPDSAFAYIEPGGEKDEGGKTTPRSKRHLPYKDKDGKPDAAHVRNALARLNQIDIPAAAKAKAKRKLVAAAKELGIETSDEEKAARTGDLAKDMSFEEIGSLIRAKLPRHQGPFEVGPDYWLEATYPEYVIVQDWDSGKRYRVPYTISGDDVTFGAAEEVEVAYVPADQSDEDRIVAAAAAVTNLAKAGRQISAKNADTIHKAASALMGMHAEAGCEKCSGAMKALAGEGEGDAGKKATAGPAIDGEALAKSIDIEPLMKRIIDQLKTADLKGVTAGDKPVDIATLTKTVQDQIAPTLGELAKAEDVRKVSEDLAKAVGSIGQLEARVKKLEDEPAPGGPVLRGVPVEKVLGGGAAPQVGNGMSEIDMLKKMQAEATDPVEKDLLGRRLAVLQAASVFRPKQGG